MPHDVGNRSEAPVTLVEHFTEQDWHDYEALAAGLPQRRHVKATLQYLFAGDFLDRSEEGTVVDGRFARWQPPSLLGNACGR